MGVPTIDPFEDFLNEFYHQQHLLKESLSEWDSILQSGFEMVKRLEEICTHTEAQPAILFLKEVFVYGQSLSFFLDKRVSMLKEIAQLTQETLKKRYH